MNVMLAGMLGGWEMVLILAVVLVLFGAKKLPELAKGLGTGIKEFKKATRDVQDELSSAMDDSPSSRRYVNSGYPNAPAEPQIPGSTANSGQPVASTTNPASQSSPTPQAKVL